MSCLVGYAEESSQDEEGIEIEIDVLYVEYVADVSGVVIDVLSMYVQQSRKRHS